MRKFFHSRYFYAVIAPVTIAAGALFLFWQELSGKLLFYDQQNVGLYYYYFSSVMKFFVYGLHMLPNWWPAFNSGYPINLTLDGFLNPISIFFLKFLSPFLTNHLITLIFFVINGSSLYALARALRLSKTGSLIASISYAFSGAVILWNLGQIPFADVMFFLPLSFLCCLKIFSGKTKWFWLWLPLLVYSWFCGFAELTVYSLAAIFFFSIYLIIKNRKAENFSYRRLILFFGAIILSVVILLPWFLAVLRFISFTGRSGGANLETAASIPTGISTLINMLYPRISIPYGELLPLIPFPNYDYLLYIGTLPLLFVIASFFIKNKKEKGYLIFFLCLAAGSILMTVNHSPLFWLFHQIPVLRWFTAYWKWSFVIVFSMAILAGYGFDHVRDFFLNRFSKKIVIFLWILIILALMGSGFIAIFDQKIKTIIINYGVARYTTVSDRAFNRTENYYQRNLTEIANALTKTFSLKNKLLLLMFILWLVALAHLTLGKYELISHGRWKVAAVMIAFLGSVLPWTGFPNGLPTSLLTTEPETAKYLHSINPYQSNKLPLAQKISQSLAPYRIFPYTPIQYIAAVSEKYGANLLEDRTLFNREMLSNNFNIAFNFDTFRSREPLASRRLDMAYILANQQDAVKSYTNKDITPFDDYVKVFSNEKNLRLLGAFNVQYILTPFKLVNNLQPVFTSRILDNKLPVYIYENPYFMPRWYFAKSIKWTKADDKTALDDLKTINDFDKTTLLEQLSLNDPAIVAKADSQDKLELQLYTAGKLIIKTKTKNYRFLVFSESRLPDFWRAYVNGEKTPIYSANYLWQAVLVPPGENTVEFRYPNLWEQGLISAESYIDSFIGKLSSQKYE